MKRPKIGDIFEISTPNGFAYVQYSHESPTRGAVIRILPGLYQERPPDFLDMLTAHELFYLLYPVAQAMAQGLIQYVRHAEIPESARDFPKMRTRGLVLDKTRTPSVENWWVWDGSREYPVGPLTDELAKLSIRQYVSHDILVDS